MKSKRCPCCGKKVNDHPIVGWDFVQILHNDGILELWHRSCWDWVEPLMPDREP